MIVGTLVTGSCSGEERLDSPPHTTLSSENLYPRSRVKVPVWKITEMKCQGKGRVCELTLVKVAQGGHTSPGGGWGMRNPSRY